MATYRVVHLTLFFVSPGCVKYLLTKRVRVDTNYSLSDSVELDVISVS